MEKELLNHTSKDLTKEEAKLIAQQLRKPEGKLGVKVSEEMNKGNEFISTYTYESLNLRKKDYVLELGFGNGRFIQSLAKKVSEGLFAGIDYSKTMVKLAKKTNLELCKKNVELQVASIDNIPYPDNYFDKVVTVNTIYFWDDATACLNEIKRVLKKDGLLVIGMRTRDGVKNLPIAQHNFTLYNKEEAVRLLNSNGFEIIETKYTSDKDFDALCLVAKK